MKEKFKYGTECAIALIVFVGLEVLDLICNYFFYKDVIECIEMFFQTFGG